MEEDILYNAAIKYAKLRHVAYEIILGRKGNSYELKLHFPYESFFHLSGMQHLEDLRFPSSNKERIFKEILNGNLTGEYLKKSEYYDTWRIEERITNLYLLESILEDNKVMYKINPKAYTQYTGIIADYLLEYKEKDIFYLFVIEEKLSPKFPKEHKGCSFFKKYLTDYTRGTAKSTLLLLNKIEKMGTEFENKIELYRNPSFQLNSEQ